jgi:two-component system, sensor histidine kinase
MKDRQEVNPVENAIALFDESQHLIIFNQRIVTLWGLSASWLKQKPDMRSFFTEIANLGYWSQAQYLQVIAAVESTQSEKSHYIKQNNGICLNAYISLTSEQGYIFTFRDVTDAEIVQANLTIQLKQQAFVLGLMERLQPASELQEIGEFALSYLVKAMGAAFGDIKIVTGNGFDAVAHVLTNQFGARFLAICGEVAIAEMETLLGTGIPYGQGLLWQVVATGKPLFVDDYKNHPNAVPAFKHSSIGDLGIFPIPAANGRIIGILTLESRSSQKLQDAPQQDMLLAACRFMGVAIERAQSQVRLSEINQDLEQASQLKSEFLTSMSHELRTPLNSILGFADLLLQQIAGSLSPRQLKYTQIISESGQHLLGLINGILDLAKIESGKAELELQSVEVAELCVQCLEMIQHRADKKRLVISQHIDRKLGQVNLDERRVRQMLINLLSNAVKFTPEGGHIKFACNVAYGSQLREQYRLDRSPINASTPYLCLEVQDTGIGIAKEKWNLLFRPFQQVDASLTREHEGTGLGLALTKRLAELHGGTISLESVENRGSIFRIWLPLTEMRGELAAKPSTESLFVSENEVEKIKDARRIWVVEDQPYNQELIVEVLGLEGYIVDLIPDGGAMMETMQATVAAPQPMPDLILLDIQLPKVDGFEIVRHLKASNDWKQIPVIAVTAMAMKGDRDRCLAAGANAYMSKPLDLNLLNQTIRAMLP